jgi:phage tail-like protein
VDSNGTKFHLILGADWQQCTLADTGAPVFSANSPIAWDGANSEVTLAPRVLEFASAPANIGVSNDELRGGAADRFGNWYWIDGNRERILVLSSGSNVTTQFWPQETAPESQFGGFSTCAIEPAAPLKLSGLAVTRDHYLTVGVQQPAGLLIFDLQHGGGPRQLTWPAGVPFAPFDFSASKDGGLWILDRANARLWKLDRTFAVIRADQQQLIFAAERADLFQPAAGGAVRKTAEQSFPLGIVLDTSSPLTGLHPEAIEALDDGSVLVLDNPPGARFSRILRYLNGQPAGQPVSADAVLAIVDSSQQKAFRLLAQDFAYLAVETRPDGARYDTLYLVGETGDQAFAFTLSLANGQLALQPIAEFLPLRLWGGKGIVAAAGQVYYDFHDRWIPLVAQRRPRYVPEGQFVTRQLDGKQPGCVWHRLLIDACLPADTQIEIQTRAHDKKDALAVAAWMDEPEPRVRPDGPEQPWAWQISRTQIKTSELLFQRAKGRYLEIRLRLAGNGRSSPRLRALRAYYPRFSYLDHYMPAVYRQDAGSASFLDRFLANFEGNFTALEDKIASVQILFDPRSAPPETLAWLAKWFGVGLDPAWTPAKRRMFLRHGLQFFEARGTIPGLLMALRLALESCDDEALFSSPVETNIRILEKFRLRTTPAAVLGAPEQAGGLPVQAVANEWTPAQGADELDRRYRAALGLGGAEPYPIRSAALPAGVSVNAWSDFSTKTLGFAPSYKLNQTPWWQGFLSRQYPLISDLNRAYRTAYASFDAIPLPADLPRVPAATRDWYLFQAIVLRARDAAHRFVVYLPMRPQDAADTALHRQRLDLARRVIELEKPAHTAYEIKFFWSAFRIGEARLGEGTLIDLGSRAPQLLRPFTLNSTGLGEGYLDAGSSCPPRPRYSRKPELQQCGAAQTPKNGSCT